MAGESVRRVGLQAVFDDGCEDDDVVKKRIWGKRQVLYTRCDVASCGVMILRQYGTLPTSLESTDEESNDTSDERFPPRSLHSCRGLRTYLSEPQNIETILNISTNVLEWYAFAVFGYLSDVLGSCFFPNSHDSLLRGFAVFGGAFLVRPLGGLLFGYIGDVNGRSLALITSVWLMVASTLAMACIPSYEQLGRLSTGALIVTRLLQGLSTGGQLMSSVVMGVESRPIHQWGYYGAFVGAAANLGTLSAGASVYVLREWISYSELEAWGWRLPNVVASLLLALCACGLKQRVQSIPQDSSVEHLKLVRQESEDVAVKPNPLQRTFAPSNRRPLLAACMVPVLGSAGFYLCFVWMSLYMYSLSPYPIASAFGINACAIFFGIIVFFPLAGHASDVWGRRRIMTVGGIIFGFGSPLCLRIISQGHPWGAFGAQLFMGIALSLWCAPMAAWLVESFEPSIRVTSAAVGYNLGVGIFSGVAPAAATYVVDVWGHTAPQYLFGLVSLIGLVGLWVVAPTPTIHMHGR